MLFLTKGVRFDSPAMDAIKKKMQAMKVEKDNAMDRSDVCEQAAKDAKVVKNFNKSKITLDQVD